jgi:TolB-like protein
MRWRFAPGSGKISRSRKTALSAALAGGRSMKIAMPMGGERHRALAMLADAGWRGQPHALLLANGFTRELLSAMVRDGLVIAVNTVVRTGGKTVPVTHMRITAAGRKALLVYPSALGA